MSEQSAIRLLQTAIENVRETCTGAKYKDLLSAVETANEAAENATGGEPAGGDDDADDPKDLKTAASKTRQEFARRKAETK
jgi:hypothetical protein